jgi:hypothetical protein
MKRILSKKRGSDDAGEGLEWVGGGLVVPCVLDDMSDESEVPAYAVWMEVATGRVVAVEEIADIGHASGVLARMLKRALKRPFVGERTRPGSVRLASEEAVAGVRKVLGEDVPITVAPIPELARLAAEVGQEYEEENGVRYMESGLHPHAIRKLFEGARDLFPTAPWRYVHADDLIRIDIPALGLEDLSVSVIGREGPPNGLMVLPNSDAFDALLRLPAGGSTRKLAGTKGLPFILKFAAAKAIPAHMRREAELYGWPVAEGDAFPILLELRGDMPGSPSTECIQIASLILDCMPAWFERHEAVFSMERFTPIHEIWESDEANEPEVTVTYPYDLFDRIPREDLEPSR